MNAQKFTSFLSMLLVFISNCFSQETTFEKSIKWGEKQLPNEFGYYNDLEILKSDDKYTYYYGCNTLGDETTIFTKISCYLARHNEISNENNIIYIEANDKDNRFKLLCKYFENNTFHIIKSFDNKQDKKIYIFHETYDILNFKLNDDIKKVTELDYSKLKNKNDLRIKAVHSSDYIVVSYAISTKSTNFLNFDILDLNGNKNWSTNNNVFIPEKGVFDLEQVLTDSIGDLYVLQKNYSDITNPYKSDLMISKYKKDEVKKSHILSLDKTKNIYKATISINNDNLYCTGLYSKTGNLSAIGIISAHLDNSLNILDEINEYAFNVDLIIEGLKSEDKSNYRNKFLKGWDFEYDIDYDHPSVIFNNDGSFYYIIEKYAKYIKNYNAQKGNIGGANYYYKDIFITYCGFDGKILWVKKIARDQKYEDYYNMLGSYFTFIDKNDQLNFIINEKDMNHIIVSDKNNSKTQLITFDKSGNFTKTNIVENKNTALQMVVSKFKIFDNILLLTKYDFLTDTRILTFKGNSITFGKIKLE